MHNVPSDWALKIYAQKEEEEHLFALAPQRSPLAASVSLYNKSFSFQGLSSRIPEICNGQKDPTHRFFYGFCWQVVTVLETQWALGTTESMPWKEEGSCIAWMQVGRGLWSRHAEANKCRVTSKSAAGISNHSDTSIKARYHFTIYYQTEHRHMYAINRHQQLDITKRI